MPGFAPPSLPSLTQYDSNDLFLTWDTSADQLKTMLPAKVLSGLGNVASYTVGTNGHFSDLQEAFDYIRGLGNPFTFSSVTGTIGVTNGSRIVTGSGTSFGTELSIGDYVDFGSSGKVYRVASVSSDIGLVLAYPFQETTIASGGTLRKATPAIVTLYPVDGLNGSFILNSTGIIDGTGVSQLTAIAVVIDFSLFSPGSEAVLCTLRLCTKSGLFVLRNASLNSKNLIGVYCEYSALTPDKYCVMDFIVSNWRARDSFSEDIFMMNGGTGYAEVSNSVLSGDWDLLMTNTFGDVLVTNSHLQSNVQSLASSLRGGGVFYGYNSSFRTNFKDGDLTGVLLEAYDVDNVTGVAGTFIFTNCTIDLNIPDGLDPTSIHAITMNANPTTLRLINTSINVFGSPSTPLDSITIHRNITGGPGTTGHLVAVSGGSRLHPQLRSSFTGTGADVSGNPQNSTVTYAASLAATQLDSFRGETFTVTLTGNVTTIPSVKNAGVGKRCRFLFTQDATGGRTIAGWNAAYSFHTAWSNTGNTSNTQSVVEFLWTGSVWRQVGAANAWF